jgi:hypothetical protein
MRHGLSRFWVRSRGIAFSGIAFSGTGSAFGFDIQFDYSKDTGNFFNRQRRILLYRAAQAFEDLFQDDLTSISPSGSNTWVAEYRHPSTGAQTSTSNLVIPAETVVIFVGARDLGDGITSESSMGSFTASGSVEWIDVLKRRGQCGITEGPNANEVAPWGGWPTLNNDLGGNLAWWEDWSDRVRIDTDVDMFWVVVRELAHVLGFGVSYSWFALVEEAVGG